MPIDGPPSKNDKPGPAGKQEGKAVTPQEQLKNIRKKLETSENSAYVWNDLNPSREGAKLRDKISAWLSVFTKIGSLSNENLDEAEEDMKKVDEYFGLD